MESNVDLVEQDSYEKFREILDEIETRELQREHKDWKDWSRHPSFTNFKVPYYLQCRNRYVENKAKYEAQFQREINNLLKQQSSGYEAARFHRHLTITTWWPPLHNRREIEEFHRHFFKYKPKDRKRLNYLMTTKITAL